MVQQLGSSTHCQINNHPHCYFTGFVKVGGYDTLWEKYGTAIGKSVLTAPTVMVNSFNGTMGNGTMGNGTMGNGTMGNYTMGNGTMGSTAVSGLEACFKLTPEWGHMFRPIDDPDYPWLGLWTTLPIMGVWYWCTDQVFKIIFTGMN